MYNDVLAQPVPDRFLDLLKDIDAMGLPQGLGSPKAHAGVQGCLQEGLAQGGMLDKKVAK